MLFDAIDHVILPVPDPDAAAEPFRRLGLTLSSGTTHRGRGTRNRSFGIGEAAASFYVELLGIADREEALRVRGAPFVEAMERGSGLRVVMLRTEDLDGAVAELDRRGARYATAEVHDGEGMKIADIAWSTNADAAPFDLRLVQYPTAAAERRTARNRAEGLATHAFPLGRLDHLAAIAPDLDAATRYWTDVLGVPLHGEVRTPAMVIRQFKVGDAIMELLGPATPDSPLAQRPAGLLSMAAFETPDLKAAVAAARRAGFTPSEPATGVLPGTRTATIPAAELSGLSLQLLEYT